MQLNKVVQYGKTFCSSTLMVNIQPPLTTSHLGVRTHYFWYGWQSW